jgi:V/A-type H+-transporting ATPase subunit A
VTIGGTVSPAGGDFEEPVTQATLSTVKVFLALSADRAYRRAFPAIDPLQSWSRYIAPLADWYADRCGPGWCAAVERLRGLLRLGDATQQMLEVAGEEGVSLDEYATWHQARLVDEVFLQQDAYDRVDVYSPLDRQRELLELLVAVLDQSTGFSNREAVRQWFARLSARFRDLNYSEFRSADYLRLAAELRRVPTHAAPADQSAR